MKLVPVNIMSSYFDANYNNLHTSTGDEIAELNNCF